MAHHPLPPNPYRLVVDLLGQGRRFALVTVLKAAGSTPRKAATRMLVDAGGEAWGTIGGGLLESEARRAAAGAIKTGKAAAFDFRFSGASARGDDPVCGGTMRVLVDPSPADHLEAFAAAAEALRCRRRGSLTTLVCGGGDRVVVRWQADHPGVPHGGHAPDGLATGRPHHFATVGDAPDGQAEILVEPVVPPPLLLVAGGGHVGQALARQAAAVGFQVVVVDDRGEYAEPTQYPTGVEVRQGKLSDLVGQWPLTDDTYVAIVGRGHKVDAEALAAVIRQPVRYVGMMGSRRKVALVRREFLEAGLATTEQFDRVHAPIGLDLGAETVEEIAASIVAQLVAVRRQGPLARPTARDLPGGTAGIPRFSG